MMAATPVFIACGDDDDDDVPESPAPTPPQEEEKPQTIDGFEYVDLGLSVKWAVCNVGAKTPLESGSYFQYGNPNASNIKTNASDLPSYNISGTRLDPATANMSEKWRMPSYDEFYELSKKCTLKLITTEAGLRYVLVQGPNGKTMQFPLAGVYPYDNKQLSYNNFQAWLLTSTLDNSGNPRPYAFKVRYTNETTGPEMRMDTDELIRLSRVNVRGVSTAAPDGASEVALCPDSNHPHTIDLGLPSGTKWTCCNIGANKPDDRGADFAWGETVGYQHHVDQHAFNWTTYKWCNGSEYTLTKYCTDPSYGRVDNKTVLDLEDDAAYVQWGSLYSIPTAEQCQELIENTSAEWISIGEVNGMKFIGKNGNAVFLPATGFRGSEGYCKDNNFTGYYHSSTLYTGDDERPCHSFYNLVIEKNLKEIWTGGRCYGSPIRPVRKN